MGIIVKNSKELFDVVTSCFAFGYMQGMKAAKAEMWKKEGAPE